MSPSAIAALLNDIQINNRLTVIECGSGISTFFLAKALSKKEGARLATIDHDGNFLNIVRSWLREGGCDHRVDFVCAPLEKLPKVFGDGDWYDTTALNRLFESPDSPWRTATIDVLVVDGPPAWEKGREKARFPAVPFFKSRLSNSCSVFLDDIDRFGEREVAKTWESELGISMSAFPGGISYGVRGSSYNIF